MNAEICFFRQHVGGFLDLDVVALGQVFAKSPVERAVDEYDLHLLQQVVRGGHLVSKGDGRRPVVLASRQHAAGQRVVQRVGQHQALAALDQLARAEAHRAAGGRGRVLHALRVGDHGRGPGFFWGRFPAAHLQARTDPLPRAGGFPLAKYQYTVPQGGKSPGKSRHTHPFLSTYKMAFTTSASGHLACRRTTKNGSRRCQSRLGKSEPYRYRAALPPACFTKLD